MSILINSTNFPDDNFRAYVQSTIMGDASASELTDEKIASTIDIDVSYSDIADLKGIEYFTALTSLVCTGNSLTTLDMSSNTALTVLMCNSNQLESLNISKNAALRSLYCGSNKLKTFDITHCTSLIQFVCNNNRFLTLDLSKNTALNILGCSLNMLESLDLSANTALYDVTCDHNRLTELDLSANTALEEIEINPHTHNGLNFTETEDEMYQVDLSQYVSDISKISNISAKSASGASIIASYANGILKLADEPASVNYFYAVNYGTNKTANLDVTLVSDPVIITEELPDTELGDTYNTKIEAEGTGTLEYAIVSGALPDGLTLDSSTGVISGTIR